MSKSFSAIKRGQAILTSVVVAEALVKEQIELANLLAEESKLTFVQALSLIENICKEILPGHQGIAKLTVFRTVIRDNLMDEFSEHCTCPPAVIYGVDIPGLGCEVCPYCAEKLEEQDIPY